MSENTQPEKTSSLFSVISASSVGTLIEWYDFYIYGSLATIIAGEFFPKGNPTAALLATLATFAAGYVENKEKIDNIASYKNILISDLLKSYYGHEVNLHNITLNLFFFILLFKTSPLYISSIWLSDVM